MRGQAARQIRQLTADLDERTRELASAKAAIRELTHERDNALLGEWAAKRGLADYMQQHGLGHRINPVVLAQIEAGPPVTETAHNDG